MYCVDSHYRPLRGGAASDPRLPRHRRRLSAQFRAREPGAVQRRGRRRPPVHAVVSAEQARSSRTRTTRRWARSATSPERSTGSSAVYGSHKRFPIYNTEFGYITTPPKRRHEDDAVGRAGHGRLLPQLGRVHLLAATRASSRSRSTCSTTRCRRAQTRLGRLRQRPAQHSETQAEGHLRRLAAAAVSAGHVGQPGHAASRSGAARVRRTYAEADTGAARRSRSSSSAGRAARSRRCGPIAVNDPHGLLRPAHAVPGQRHRARRLDLPRVRPAAGLLRPARLPHTSSAARGQRDLAAADILPGRCTSGRRQRARLPACEAICGAEHVLTHPHELATYRSDGLAHYRQTPIAAVLPGTAERGAAGRPGLLRGRGAVGGARVGHRPVGRRAADRRGRADRARADAPDPVGRARGLRASSSSRASPTSRSRARSPRPISTRPIPPARSSARSAATSPRTRAARTASSTGSRPTT